MKIEWTVLRDLDVTCGGECVKQSTIIGHTRWTVRYEVVFEYEGKHWRVQYNVPATEIQDGSASWEFEDTAECQECELKKVEREVWVDVSPRGKGER